MTKQSFVERWDAGCDSRPLLQEADKEIERLRAENAELTRCLDGGVDCAHEKRGLRALVGRMLPYVQRWEPADAAELEVQKTLEDEAERLLYGHEPSALQGPGSSNQLGNIQGSTSSMQCGCGNPACNGSGVAATDL